MAFAFAPILHIVAAIFSIIELGLTAYCTSHINPSNLDKSITPFILNKH